MKLRFLTLAAASLSLVLSSCILPPALRSSSSTSGSTSTTPAKLTTISLDCDNNLGKGTFTQNKTKEEYYLRLNGKSSTLYLNKAKKEGDITHYATKDSLMRIYPKTTFLVYITYTDKTFKNIAEFANCKVQKSAQPN